MIRTVRAKSEVATAAKYGALASLPWCIIEGFVLTSIVHHELLSPWLTFALTISTGLILGVPLGALGAILFVKLRGIIPGRSTLVKAVIFSAAVWVLMSLNFSLSPPRYPSFALGSLFGQLIWAALLARFLDRKWKEPNTN